MYIGYNTSGGGEGFTVYLQSQDFAGNSGLEILHAFNGYKYSGGAGNIIFSIDSDIGTSKYDIQIIDNDTIKLVVDNKYEYDGSPVFAEYTFKREELTKERLSQYEGTWIEAGIAFSIDGKFGNVEEFAYCDECGSIHAKDYDKNRYNDYHSKKLVSLYDGEKLHHIFPIKGLYDRDFDLVCYVEELYVIDGKMMTYSMYNHDGVGGGLAYRFFRKGSDEVKVAEALNAYYQYIYDNYSSTPDYTVYDLIYIDDDGVPELLFDNSADGRGTKILCYNNGVVYDSAAWCRGYDFSYIPRQNKVAFCGVMGQSGTETIGHLENGVLVEDYSCNFAFEESGEWLYTLNGNNYTREEFYNIWHTYFDFDNAEFGWNPLSSSLLEAYENLGATEYGYSLSHVEAMSYDKGVLYIKVDNGEEISYQVADDCVWEFDDPFSKVPKPITYKLVESDWHDCRSHYLEYSEELNYSVTVAVKDKQVIRVYTVHN